MATEVEVIEVIEQLVAAYPSFNPRDAERMAAQYVAGLIDLPVEGLQQAALAVMRESRWFPTIAELRARVPDSQAQETPAQDRKRLNVIFDNLKRRYYAGELAPRAEWEQLARWYRELMPPESPDLQCSMAEHVLRTFERFEGAA